MPPAFDQVIENLHTCGVKYVIVGANAAIAQGAPIGTIDLDLCYERSRDNIERLVKALAVFNPRLRGVGDAVPFEFKASTLRKGCNFTFATDAGDIDLLGNMTGVGDYRQVVERAVSLRLFKREVLVMSLEDVIKSKKAAGRAKDKAVLPVLEETLVRSRRPS